MNIQDILTRETSLPRPSIDSAMKLLDEGNTVPFIARYRKEATGNLSDAVLRFVQERVNYLRGVEQRQITAIKAIEEQGKLTPELQQSIEQALTLIEVEELYKPYKQKRKTRAVIAREAGLEPLALFLKKGVPGHQLMPFAASFLKPDLGVDSPEKAIRMACDIIAEELSEKAEIRAYCKRFVQDHALIVSEEIKKDERDTYGNYAHFSSPLKNLPGFRLLAINRGENQGCLKVKLDYESQVMVEKIATKLIRPGHPYGKELYETVEDSLKRLILPSIETLVRSEAFDKAEEHSIEIFKKNTAALLLYPPLGHKRVMGFDPGFRTGCKWATVDENGVPMQVGVAFVTIGNADAIEREADKVTEVLKSSRIDYLALGNGTASREAEEALRKAIERAGLPTKIVIVNESGASVYSASPIGEKEFPKLPVEKRSAISLARRLQDPLNELVKSEPKSIGVGQYQHDMDQKKLGESLSNVVQDCVAKVGVNLNNATPMILTYIPGIGPTLADNIYSHLKKNGPFRNRRELLQVERLGPKAYEQAIGFLRVYGGDEPLDVTAIHPESYPVAKFILSSCNIDLLRDDEEAKKEKMRQLSLTMLQSRFPSLGKETFRDVVEEIIAPGRDIREDAKIVELNQQARSIEDLRVGMVLQGTVRNIMDFGMFVDINVHVDGLVHISEVANKFVKNISELYSIGDIVKVKVVSVDVAKKRIGLSVKQAQA